MRKEKESVGSGAEANSRGHAFGCTSQGVSVFKIAM